VEDVLININRDLIEHQFLRQPSLIKVNN